MRYHSNYLQYTRTRIEYVFFFFVNSAREYIFHALLNVDPVLVLRFGKRRVQRNMKFEDVRVIV